MHNIKNEMIHIDRRACWWPEAQVNISVFLVGLPLWHIWDLFD